MLSPIFSAGAGAVLLAASLSFRAAAATAPDPATTARLPAAAPPLTAVLDVERPRDADLLLLRNGERWSGALLNESYSLRTGYGQVKFARQMLAGLDFTDSARSLDRVVTVNSDQFSGFIEDDFFTFQPKTGESVQVRRDQVAKVIFRTRDGELPDRPRGRWVRLKNGDGFSGQVLADPLTILSNGAPVSVSLKETVSLAFTGGSSPLTTITWRTGPMLQGKLTIDDIPFLLDIGLKLQVCFERIDSIRERLDQEPTAGAPTPQPGRMNLAGAAPTPAPAAIEGLVWIPAGEFTMGSPTDEAGRDQDESPQTRVVLPQGFWMGKCEVTQAEFQAEMGINPSNFIGDPARPVERVTWREAMEYCAKRTQRAQAAGQLPAGCVYRLPTEAEWEYACRAGTTTRFSHGDDKGFTQLGTYAWFVDNSEPSTHPVGAKQPNPWGLYDLPGNVWEWCLDRWEGALPGGTVTNHTSVAEGALRVARGGSWLYDGRACRSANRDDYSPSNRCSDVGFRVVLAPLQP